MSDALTTITHLINSPPGQLAAGAVLAGIVWKFFERVEAVLTDQTKLEIAVWLLGRKKFGPKVQPWPETFARLVDRMFGVKRLSWKCFWRSCITSYVSLLFVILADWLTFPALPQDRLMVMTNNLPHHFQPGFSIIAEIVSKPHFILPLVCLGALNVMPNYASLLETRWLLGKIQRGYTHSKAALLVIADLLLTVAIARSQLAIVETAFSLFGASTAPGIRLGLVDGYLLAIGARVSYPIWALILDRTFWLYPAFFTSAWLWLYAGSGFLLKAARRFDIGFEWFNRHFDIENKPLQSIGLVAGALVAVMYWAAVIVSRVVG